MVALLGRAGGARRARTCGPTRPSSTTRCARSASSRPAKRALPPPTGAGTSCASAARSDCCASNSPSRTMAVASLSVSRAQLAVACRASGGPPGRHLDPRAQAVAATCARAYWELAKNNFAVARYLVMHLCTYMSRSRPNGLHARMRALGPSPSVPATCTLAQACTHACVSHTSMTSSGRAAGLRVRPRQRAAGL